MSRMEGWRDNSVFKLFIELIVELDVAIYYFKAAVAEAKARI